MAWARCSAASPGPSLPANRYDLPRTKLDARAGFRADDRGPWACVGMMPLKHFCRRAVPNRERQANRALAGLPELARCGLIFTGVTPRSAHYDWPWHAARDQLFPPRWIGMDRWGIGPTGGPRGDVRNVAPPRRHRRDHLPGRPANARSPQPLFSALRTKPIAPH